MEEIEGRKQDVDAIIDSGAKAQRYEVNRADNGHPDEEDQQRPVDKVFASDPLQEMFQALDGKWQLCRLFRRVGNQNVCFFAGVERDIGCEIPVIQNAIGERACLVIGEQLLVARWFRALWMYKVDRQILDIGKLNREFPARLFSTGVPHGKPQPETRAFEPEIYEFRFDGFEVLSAVEAQDLIDRHALARVLQISHVRCEILCVITRLQVNRFGISRH